jgi:hypothetical protein
VIAAIATAALALAVPGAAFAAGDEEGTEDVLYMEDGRVLHGHILSETSKTIVFEVVNRRLNLRSTLAISRDDIAQIERGVEIGEVAVVEPTTRRPAAVTSRPDSRTTPESRFGRVVADDLDVPGIYMIPMKGQLGTDIHPSIYQDVAKDVRSHNPDMIVLVMDCKDTDDLMIPLNEATEQGLFMHHEYREIVDLFRDELREYPQVMWVEDSQGFSSLLAMAWENIYMTPEARLGGLRQVAKRAEGWSDPDVAAKMMAAWTGIGRGFLENGGYDKELADAMMRPEYSLSASFKGREVVWSLNDSGEFLVDGDEEETVGFRSKPAEDLLVSQGTADNLDDLAFLLGYREYRLLGGQGESIVETYKDNWRRTFDQTQELMRDYQQHRQWATGDETLKYLGRAKSELEKIIRSMERYDAVEIRWRTDFGITKHQLMVEVEKIREIITALKQGGGGGGGYGGGGRGIGGGG